MCSKHGALPKNNFRQIIHNTQTSMKKEYVKPQIAEMEMEAQDIICTSGENTYKIELDSNVEADEDAL